MEKGKLIQNSLFALLFQILQQMFSRGLTFVLNVLIIRAVSAELMGVKKECSLKSISP